MFPGKMKDGHWYVDGIPHFLANSDIQSMFVQEFQDGKLEG